MTGAPKRGDTVRDDYTFILFDSIEVHWVVTPTTLVLIFITGLVLGYAIGAMS